MLLVVAAMAGVLTVPARNFGGNSFYRSWRHGLSPR